MLLIVEDDLAIQKCYVRHLERRKMVQNLHYVFASSFNEVVIIMESYDALITDVVVDHNLLGPYTGADVIRYLIDSWPNMNLIRCSAQAEIGYPFGTQWFVKHEMGRALEHLFGPVVREKIDPFWDSNT